MNLIEAYVYEVTRRLPEKSRDDIAMELTSTIEDMLPENYSEVDIKDALLKLGNPADLAASYRDKPMYLIGPKVYDAYIWAMKMTIPWAILITILVHVVESIVLFTGEEAILSVVIRSFGLIIGEVIAVLIHVFFWMTIVFVVIDRAVGNSEGNLTKYGSKWTPDDLKNVVYTPKKKRISRGETLFSIIWTVIWAIVYFNADHLAGVYRSLEGADGLQFVMPVFNQETLMLYWPIVIVLIVLELSLATYKWKIGQWTMRLATLNTIIHVLSVVAFIVIISNPDLINEAFLSYMAELTNTTLTGVTNVMNWALWTSIVAIIVTIAIEIYDSYKKARIKG